jgi:hypothetical protein
LPLSPLCAAEAEAARRRLRSLMRDAARAGHTQRRPASAWAGWARSSPRD